MKDAHPMIQHEALANGRCDAPHLGRGMRENERTHLQQMDLSCSGSALAASGSARSGRTCRTVGRAQAKAHRSQDIVRYSPSLHVQAAWQGEKDGPPGHAGESSGTHLEA